MLFNSYQFLIFFPIVVLAYFIIPNKIKYLWLLAASYFFYMCWNAEYAALILISTVVTYISGLLLQKVKIAELDLHKKALLKKAVVVGSFVINLGILFYFKYTNFILVTATELLNKMNIQVNIREFDIILPIGISFYTFQALSYTMDVYRDEIYAEKNFFRYALFVSFFPQLVAGPIERSKNLLKQLAVPQKFSFERARNGILLMLWGYFLKMVLADRMAIFVDTVYGNPVKYSGYYIVMATVLFAFQIYCDFYGYSVIAMGASEILGIKLMENFSAPYLSRSVSEFWRKWHISLTSWFRDYLYFPLGGSRKGKIRKYVNKLIVFLVSGLWHGASFSFVLWGGVNGIYQIAGELLEPLRCRLRAILHLNNESIAHKLAACFLTFGLIDFTWIFFRAGSWKQSVDVIKAMCAVNNPWIIFDGSLYKCGLDDKNFFVMVIGLLILLFADICKHYGISIRNIIINQDYWCRWLIISGSIMIILVFGVWGNAYDASGFIYFQF